MFCEERTKCFHQHLGQMSSEFTSEQHAAASSSDPNWRKDKEPWLKPDTTFICSDSKEKEQMQSDLGTNFPHTEADLKHLPVRKTQFLTFSVRRITNTFHPDWEVNIAHNFISLWLVSKPRCSRRLLEAAAGDFRVECVGFESLEIRTETCVGVRHFWSCNMKPCVWVAAGMRGEAARLEAETCISPSAD